MYVAFDILYEGSESLIDLPLRTRQQRLAAAVRGIAAGADGVRLGPPGSCLRGRIVTLLPDVPTALPFAGGGAGCRVACGADEAG